MVHPDDLPGPHDVIPGNPDDPHCIRCGKTPDQIEEYSQDMTGEDLDPVEYVKQEEGTYNPANGHFACTSCYIAMGMPTAPRGWKAP